MLNRVAILIPTYNRPGFILDICKFYSMFNSPNYIIILGDSSSAKEFTQNKEIIENFPNIRVMHVRCPKQGPHEALLTITKVAIRENIKYCMFTGDDDYVYINSLKVLTQFLDKHSEFRSVRGRALLVGVKDKKRSESLKKITFYQKYWHSEDISQNHALDRLEFLLENYINLQFAIHRSLDFKAQLAAQTGLTMGFYQEYSESLCSATRGKSKFLDVPFLVRLSHQYYGGNSYETNKKDATNNTLNLLFQFIFDDEPKKLANNILKSLALEKKYKKIEMKYVKEILVKKLYKTLEKNNTSGRPQVKKSLILEFVRRKVQKFRLKAHRQEIALVETFYSVKNM